MTPRTTTDGEPDLPRWFAATFEVLQDLTAGRLDVVLPDRRVFRVEGPEPGPAVVLDVANPGLFARLLRDGELGFAEAYMDGWWTTPDLQALLDVLLRSNETVGRKIPGLAIIRLYERARHWLRSNSRTQAARNIAHHYDLGNGFYETWLDASMTYSSALFKTGQEDLEQAQRQKYAALADMIDLQPGDRVLEIGSGWGGFAEYAAKDRGASVTGLTISRAQYDYAQARAQRLGLEARMTFALRDYRDETGTYDKIASIEMFEAVGERYWPQYFDTVRDRLRPDGKAGLQIITIADHLFDNYRKSVDFVQKYIFPGGMLPSVSGLRSQIERAGLAEAGLSAFGDSYSQTLRRWRDTFNDAWADIATLGFDDRFYRMWNFYLASCASCFEARTTDVVQVALRRPA